MEIQLETCKSMITESKTLAQDVSENRKGGWNKIPSMYKKILFVMNAEDVETSANEISTQGIEIFHTKTDTEAHILLEIVLKHQGLYCAYLHISNVKQIAQVGRSWPSEFVTDGVSSILIQNWNPMSNFQAQNALVLSLKTTHQMDDSAIKKLSESDISMPITQEEFFRDLSFRSEILRCFLSGESLLIRNLSDATKMLQRTSNKLKTPAITDAQVYIKTIYRIDKRLNYWVQE